MDTTPYYPIRLKQYVSDGSMYPNEIAIASDASTIYIKNTAGTVVSGRLLNDSDIDAISISGTTSGSGNAITAISVSGKTITATKGSTFLTAHPTITKTADTSSSTTATHGGTIIAVDSITRETNGHVTTINTKTVTLPSETTLSLGTTTGSGNAISDISVSGHTITLAKANTFSLSTHSHTVSNISDLTVTAAELNYSGGVTSNIQTQLDAKLASSANAVSATKLATARTIAISGDATGTATSFDGSTNITIPLTLGSSGATAGTYKSVTVNAKGLVTAATNPTTLSGYGIIDAASATHIHGNITNAGAIGSTSGLAVLTTTSGVLTTGTIPIASGGTGATTAAGVLTNLGLTATAAELNVLDGITATVTELNYTDGVTSNIQTQLDDKLGSASNAVSATKLATARTISLTGDATGSFSFDGSANSSAALTLASSGVTSGSYGPSTSVSPVFGGTFAVPYITFDSKGRATSALTNTITIPVQTSLSLGTTSGSGNAITDITVSGHIITMAKASTFLTAHPTITLGSDTTSTASPAFGGTFTAIDGVTKDANGHVTLVNTKTITLPDETTLSLGTTIGSGNAVTNITVSGHTVTMAKSSTFLTTHPTITLGTDTASTSSPTFGGTFTAIDGITKDSNGHVTLVNTKTITIPSETTLSLGTTTGSGNAVTGITVSGHTVTMTKGSTFLTTHPTITLGTDTTSTVSPAFGGTFTAIDGLTKDSNGHVTLVNTKTITIPSQTSLSLGTTSGSGNAITDVSVSGHIVTLTKGSTFSLNGHTHTPSNITPSGYTTGTLDLISSAFVGSAISNKTFALPASAITIEYSTDGGITWVDYGATDDQKKSLFCETRSASFYLGKATVAGSQTTDCMLRITIIPSDRYTSVRALYTWFSTSGNTSNVTLERSTIGDKTTFTTLFSNYPISGWSGNNIYYFSEGTFGGSESQTSNYYSYRITYTMTAVTASYAAASLSDIRFFGTNVWSIPNNMVSKNHLYGWDTSLNAIFPAGITATSFTGNASSATKLQTSRTISLTGDATGNLSFDGSVDSSATLTLASSGVTSGSYGPSANSSPAFGGTFSVPYITFDSKGRATSASTNTITIPSQTSLSLGTTTGTGNAVSNITVSGHTITMAKASTFLTAHPTISTLIDTTSTSAPAGGETFTAVDSVTRDANGHVTTINTKTVTIPTAQQSETDIIITDSGTGNAVTSITAVGSDITVTKDSTFLTAHPSISLGTDTTSTATPAFGGTFTAIDGVTKDGNGHVTLVNTKTVTVPTQTTLSLGTTTGTGNAVSNITVSGHTITMAKASTFLTAHPSIGVATDTTSSVTATSGGTFTSVDSVTRDTNGHVTKINTKTITMPTLSSGGATTVTYTATIGTTWTGTSAPYTQNIAVTGMLSTDNPIVDINFSSVAYADKANIVTAWGSIYRIATYANGITIYSDNATTTSVPIQLKVVH